MSLNTPVDGAIGLQLASGYTAGSGSLVLKAGQGAKFTTFPTIVTVITFASYNTGASEVLCEFTVTGKSTDTLTGVAAVAGFTDQNFATNDYVEGRVSAKYITDVNAVVSQITLAGALTTVGAFSTTLTTTGTTSVTLPTSGTLISTSITETSETANFSAVAGVNYVISGTSNLTATLPTAVGITGQSIRIRCATGYTKLVTIATTSAQTIGPSAATTQYIYAGETATLMSDGANWVRTGGLIIPCHCKIHASAATQSIAAQANVTVLLNSTDIDTSGQMATLGSNAITILRPGIYTMTGTAAWAVLSTSNSWVVYTSVAKNTSPLMHQLVYIGNTIALGDPFLLPVIMSSTLAAGDVLTLLVFQTPNSGTPAVNLIGTGTNSGVTYQTSLEVIEVPQW
jgi:hypothetical protein